MGRHCAAYKCNNSDIAGKRKDGFPYKEDSFPEMRVISFIVGLYSGAYICQNYEVPHIPGPIGLWEKVQKVAKQFEKKNED